MIPNYVSNIALELLAHPHRQARGSQSPWLAYSDIGLGIRLEDELGHLGRLAAASFAADDGDSAGLNCLEYLFFVVRDGKICFVIHDCNYIYNGVTTLKVYELDKDVGSYLLFLHLCDVE